jgi:hypothetical protein
MEIFLSLLTLLLPFTAALVGIRGNTWNSKKRSFYKISVAGWAALAIACMGLMLATLKFRENRKLTRHNESVRKIILAEIELATKDYALDPFLEMLMQIESRTDESRLFDGSRFYSDLAYPIEALTTINVVKLVREFYFCKKIDNPLYSSVWGGYGYRFEKLKIQLNVTISKYRAFMPHEILIAIEELLQDRFFKQIILAGPGRLKTAPSLDYSDLFISGDKPRYLDFLRKMEQLTRVIEGSNQTFLIRTNQPLKLTALTFHDGCKAPVA